jgi:hypothetical protein
LIYGTENIGPWQEDKCGILGVPVGVRILW